MVFVAVVAVVGNVAAVAAVDPRNLPLKFGQNRVSDSCDVVVVVFLLLVFFYVFLVDDPRNQSSKFVLNLVSNG